MKLYVLCAVISVVMFGVGLAWQSGSLPGDADTDDEPAAAPSEKKKAAAAPAKRLHFPHDLTPAAQARAVSGAAAFKPGPHAHKIAFLCPDGRLHEWHDSIPEEWRAYRVEETELVVVVGKQKKIFVDRVDFTNGPPMERYIFEVTISVVEPKTGKIVGYKIFRHVPRAVQRRESYAVTMLGRPVPWSMVYQWVASMTRIGFPEEIDSTPIERETLV
jgi:hypothetical protein